MALLELRKPEGLVGNIQEPGGCKMAPLELRKTEERRRTAVEERRKKEQPVERRKTERPVERRDADVRDVAGPVGRRKTGRPLDHRKPMHLHRVCEWERHRRVRDRVRDRDRGHDVHDVHVHPLLFYFFGDGARKNSRKSK